MSDKLMSYSEFETFMNSHIQEVFEECGIMGGEAFGKIFPELVKGNKENIKPEVKTNKTWDELVEKPRLEMAKQLQRDLITALFDNKLDNNPVISEKCDFQECNDSNELGTGHHPADKNIIARFNNLDKRFNNLDKGSKNGK